MSFDGLCLRQVIFFMLQLEEVYLVLVSRCVSPLTVLGKVKLLDLYIACGLTVYCVL